MGTEIERRYIVQGNKWKKFIKNSQDLKQGYLITNKNGWTIRVRIIDNKEANLTLKYPKEGIERYEYEYLIPLSEGEELLELAKYKIIKTRYQLQMGKKLWFIDCFKGKNFPLVLAEIELKSSEEIFDKPEWCSIEVSSLKEWSNAGLAKLPLSMRPIEKRRVFL
tara:strand:- start:4525 stop:5019 length:495 start_codon:yes stop_codon:yes gene_type:complete